MCIRDRCWDVYKGWAQFALTAECAEYVLSVYDSNLHFNRYMKHRFPPDEIYVHTILYNSLYKERISTYSLIPRKASTWKSSDLNLTYFEYPTTCLLYTSMAINYCATVILTGLITLLIGQSRIIRIYMFGKMK